MAEVKTMIECEKGFPETNNEGCELRPISSQPSRRVVLLAPGRLRSGERTRTTNISTVLSEANDDVVSLHGVAGSALQLRNRFVQIGLCAQLVTASGGQGGLPLKD
jgi:hypothetical protein